MRAVRSRVVSISAIRRIRGTTTCSTSCWSAITFLSNPSAIAVLESLRSRMYKFLATATLLAGTTLMWAATNPETTLLEAAESGDHATAMRLVSTKGVNVNAAEADGATAIMYAAASDDVE